MRRCYRHLWSSTDLSPVAKRRARAAGICAPSFDPALRAGLRHRSRAGFAIGPILYLLALIGIGAGILFSGYSQILRSNVQITENMQAQNDLAQAATVLAASSILGSSDNMVLCPPTSGSASANCSLSSLKLESFAAAAAAGGSAQLPTNYASAGTTGTPAGFEVGVFAPGSGMKQLDPYGRYYVVCRWERLTSDSTNNSIQVMSAGPDGTLNTPCGNTTTNPTNDDLVVAWTAPYAVQHSAVWQTTTGGGGNETYFGNSGHQLSVDANGDLTVPGYLAVTGTATFGGTGNFTGAVTAPTFNGNFVGGTVSGTNASFTGTLGVTGATTLSSTLGVTGDSTLGGQLAVTGATTVASTLGVTGATTLSSTLGVTGNTNLSGALAVTGTAIYGTTTGEQFIVYPLGSVAANGGFMGNLTGNVTGATGSFSSTLTATSLGAGTGTFSGLLQANSGLTVAGAANFTLDTSGNGAFAGTVTAAKFNGNFNFGSGGGDTITGVIPLASGGTGIDATSNNNLLYQLGVLNTSNYLNMSLIQNGTVQDAMLQSTVGGSGATFYSVTVTAQGIVTGGSTTPIVENYITDGSDSVTATGGQIDFTTSGVENDVINSQGWLGILTTTPVVPLTVGNPYTALNANQVAQFASGGATSTIAVRSASGGVTSAGILGVTTSGSATTVTLGTNATSGTSSIAFQVGGATQATIDGSGDVVATNFDGNLVGGAISGTSEALSGTLTGTSAYFSGTVTANNLNAVNAYFSGTVTVGNVSIGGGISSGIYLGTSTTANPMIFNEPTSGFYTPGANTIAVETGGSTALTVTATQSVGIGTSSPGASLDIETNTILGSPGRGLIVGLHDSTAASSLITIQKSRGTGTSPTAVANGDYGNSIAFSHYDGTSYSANDYIGTRINGTVGTSSVPTDIFFATSIGGTDTDPYANGNVKMVIASGGNVGIGTTSPAAVLDVETANNQHIAVRNLSSEAQLLAMTNGAGAYAKMLLDASPLVLNSSSTANIEMVPNGGNVGIGTTAPGEPLEVNGTILADNLVQSQGTNAGHQAFDRTANGNSSIFYRTGNISRLWDNSYGDVIAYNSSGYVGVDTETFTTNFNIGGSEYATGNIVANGCLGASNGGGYTCGGYMFYANGAADITGNLTVGGSLNTSSISTGSLAVTGLATVEGGLQFSGTSLNVGGYSRASLISLFPNLNTGGGAAFAWNYTSGSGETDLFVNEGGGSPGGFNIYNVPDASGSPTNIFTVTSAGYVGIGTTNPGAALSVPDGMATFATNTPQAGGWKVTIGGTYGLYASTSGGTAVYATDSGTTGSTAAGQFENASPNGYAVYAFGTGYGIYSGSGTNYFNGNVGIGTAAPAYPLQVIGESVVTNVLGTAIAATTSAAVYAVIGYSISSSGGGVEGTNSATGTSAALGLGSYGVYANGGSGSSSYGVYSSYSGINGAALYGASLKGTTTSDDFAVIGYSSASGCTGWLASDGGGSAGGNCSSSFSSDARLKKQVAPVPDGLATIMKLQPVTFLWKRDSKNHALVTNKDEKAKNYGFIAQDVEKVLPALVTRQSETMGQTEGVPVPPGGFLGLDYNGLIAPTVKAVQELYGKWDADHDTLVALRADNDNLHRQIAELQMQMKTSGSHASGAANEDAKDAAVLDWVSWKVPSAAAANDNAPISDTIAMLGILGGGFLIVTAAMAGTLWQTRREMRLLRAAIKKAA